MIEGPRLKVQIIGSRRDPVDWMRPDCGVRRLACQTCIGIAGWAGHRPKVGRGAQLDS